MLLNLKRKVIPMSEESASIERDFKRHERELKEDRDEH
jgi:hypothetical protein